MLELSDVVSHPPRLKDFEYIGRHYYFLTFCTYRRLPHFRDARLAGLVGAQLLESSRKCEMAIHVYTVMPDHVHVVAQGVTDDADLHAFMGDLKQRTGWRFRRDHHGRLWQGSYYDHVLRPEENFAGTLEYVVNNPVRAGLASKPEEYPFWDSFTQSREGLLAFMRGQGDWRSPGHFDTLGQPIKG